MFSTLSQLPLRDMTITIVAIIAIALLSVVMFTKGVLDHVQSLLDLLRLLATVKIVQKRVRVHGWTVCDDFERLADRHGSDLAFICAEDGREVTFAKLEQRANQFARWAQSKGIKQDDCVALMIHSSPELVAFWLGMAKLSAATALVNVNVTGRPLAHIINTSVETSSRRIAVIDESLAHLVTEETRRHMLDNVEIYYWKGLDSQAGPSSSSSSSLPIINEEVASSPSSRLPLALRSSSTWSSKLLYIFTSGTTGMSM